MTKLQNLLKPFFVYVAYVNVESIGSYGGSTNPTINFLSFVWSAISYNYGDDYTTKNYFDENHYGRYAWVYVLAPVIASVFAGVFAGKHATQIDLMSFKKKGGIVGI